MRKVRGSQKLVSYLESIQCPISESTIYRLMRTKNIPYSRPSSRIVIFDLDEIDQWIGSEAKEQPTKKEGA